MTNDAPDLRVTRGVPAAEELAALIAVVSEAYEHERTTEVVDDEDRSPAWGRARRMRRTPQRGASWGRFSG